MSLKFDIPHLQKMDSWMAAVRGFYLYSPEEMTLLFFFYFLWDHLWLKQRILWPKPVATQQKWSFKTARLTKTLDKRSHIKNKLSFHSWKQLSFTAKGKSTEDWYPYLWKLALRANGSHKNNHSKLFDSSSH